MPGRFATVGMGRGGVMQSAVPKVNSQTSAPTKAGGLVLRGVVLVRYVYDDPADAASASGGVVAGDRRAVYCDVLIYSTIRTMHGAVIPRVLVPQDRGSRHEGEIGGPRPTTVDISGTFDPEKSNPADLDGSHVLVGFIDDELALPVILGYLPHPNAGAGVPPENALVERLRLQVVDGDPWLHKHHGALVGVDDRGNWTLDLRRAHDGVLTATGDERPGADRPDPERLDGGGDALAGNFHVQLPADAKLTIDWPDSGRRIELTDSDGKLVLTAAKVDVGAGATEAAVQGTKWGLARAPMNATLIAQLTAIGQTFTGLATSLAASVVLSPLALPFGTLGAAFMAMAQAITTFEGTASGDAGKYLSDDVKIR